MRKTIAATAFVAVLITGAPAAAEPGGSTDPSNPDGPRVAAVEAAAEPRLDLTITSSPNYDVPVADGDTVSFTYTVTNDTDAPIANPAGSGVRIFFKWDYDLGDWPEVTDCDFDGWDFGDYGDHIITEYGYVLPATMQPGDSASCTLTYTTTAADVAYGGLWTMLVYAPDTDTGTWDYSYWLTIPAVGTSDLPTIVGTPAVGSPLTVEGGLWGPWDDPSLFSYTWFRDGELIDGAAGDTYTPTSADLGHQLTAKVFSGQTGVSLTSTPTAPVVAGATFTDVPVSAPFFAEIAWLVGRGITTGYPDNTFRPSSPVERQAMAAFLYRFAGEPEFTPPATPSFTDVPVGSPFYTEVEWLASTGITTGWPDGTFRPTAPVERQAMAAFLYRFAGEPDYTAPSTPSFLDVPASSTFYAEVEWLAAIGVTTGWPDGTFRPAAKVERQAMAAFLMRFDAS